LSVIISPTHLHAVDKSEIAEHFAIALKHPEIARSQM
jgi:hypothetical protein